MVQGFLYWLGQSGFLIEIPGAVSQRILIDPFLTPAAGARRSYFQITDLGPIDWVFTTHEHLDHFDSEAIATLKRRNPGLRIVAPGHLASRVIEAGFQPSEYLSPPLRKWTTLSSILKIVALPSVHALHPHDGYGTAPDEQFLGYVFDIGGIHVYHSGDTILSETLLQTLVATGVDVALLPINGRDFFRESHDIAGNLTECEAVEMAGRIGAKILIPMHYDAFDNNRGDVGRVVRYAHDRWPRLTVPILGYGEEWPIYRPGTLGMRSD